MNFFTRPKNLKDKDDTYLLNSYRESGDIAVLSSLFERKVPLVYGLCLKYLKDGDSAKDAVMGIFEELIKKVKQHEINNFHSWLYVLAKNYCLMQLREEKKIDIISLDGPVEFLPFLHHDDNGREAALTILEACLDKLTAAQKQSVSLFYLKEKCYKEIAGLTGFTLNEVKSYIQNGKRNLKICMEKENG
jgi:RNA polymerase sigma-70 factor (ECF subfamily)